MLTSRVIWQRESWYSPDAAFKACAVGLSAPGVILDTGERCFPDLSDRNTTRDLFAGRTTTLHLSVSLVHAACASVWNAFQILSQEAKRKQGFIFVCSRVHKL